MIIPVNGSANKRWPFVASLPTQQKPEACAVVAPASGGSGEAFDDPIARAIALAQFRADFPRLAAHFDRMRAQA